MGTNWNPSDLSGLTLSNANLTAAKSGGGGQGRTVGDGGASGKVYYECVVGGGSFSNGTAAGFANSTFNIASGDSSGDPNAITAWTDGNVWMDNGVTPVGAWTGAAITGAGGVISCAIDTTNKRFWARYNNGNWNNSGAANPATNTGGYAITNAGPYYGIASIYDGVTLTLQAATLSIPSGFTDLMVASGAYSLTAAASAFTETGVAAGALVGRLASAALGIYALSGVDAALTKASPGAYSLTAAATGLTLAGQANGLGADRRVSVSPAGLALAGLGAELGKAAAAGHLLAAAVAGVGLTGRAIAFVTDASGWSALGGATVAWTPSGGVGGIWAPAAPATGAWP